MDFLTLSLSNYASSGGAPLKPDPPKHWRRRIEGRGNPNRSLSAATASECEQARPQAQAVNGDLRQ
jgi:hypothetical protein